MRLDRLRAHILENATEIVRLYDAIGDTFANRDRDAAAYAAWQAAAAEFHARYDDLAFPGGYAGAIERLTAGDPDTIDAAVAFLEARPFFHRSGYIRTALLRRMKRLAVGTPYAARIAAIVDAERARKAGRRRS